MIEIVEVGPRDGLQNEARTLTQEQRLAFIQHLVGSGLKRVEVGAFVSPKWVPQMAGSLELIQKLYTRPVPKGVRYSALVPNVRGMEDALKTPVPEVAIFGAASESFSKSNINCSIAESLERFEGVIRMARQNKRKKARAALNEIMTQLASDGWQLDGKSGEGWWEYKYHR